MSLLAGYRNADIISNLSERIREEMSGVDRDAALMEVCGTHTMNICRYGLRSMLPKNLRLLSGPGCPVCVTPQDYIDKAVHLAGEPGVIVATFGDMLRVPGSESSLEKERAKGSEIKILYSPDEALTVAEENPKKEIILLGVGFETTSPLVAAVIDEAKERNISNFAVLSAHKLIPPALRLISNDPGIKIDGFICPGHVSVIIGSEAYLGIAGEYGRPCVITGFEPVDILEGILRLVKQVKAKESRVENAYERAVSSRGNPTAVESLRKIFEVADSEWRGMGLIPESGLKIRREYEDFDAAKKFDIKLEQSETNVKCICGDVLKGKSRPVECELFGNACTPENPVGACMVSSEGTCAAYYKYGE